MGASDLSFSMIVRLMDMWSGPGEKVRASMVKMAAQAKATKAEMGGKIKSAFSTAALEAQMQRSTDRIARQRARLTGALAMGAAVGAPLFVAGNFQEALHKFQSLAEIDDARVARLRQELSDLRAPTGMSNMQLLEGLETYVGKGMGLDEALASLRATGRSAKATYSEFGTMAASGFSTMDNLKVAPESLDKAFNVMAKSGKEGSFELAAMARNFPVLTAGAKALKMEGLDSVGSIAAALQIAMKSAGSEDQAANNMANFMGKITAPDTVKKFKKFGVNIEKELAIALKRGSDPLEHMMMVIEKITKGDAFKMGELFADKQVLDFLRAMIPNLEEYRRIKGEALGAEGVIDADFDNAMRGFNEQLRQAGYSLKNLLGGSGALLPIATDLVKQFTSSVEAVAAWTAANPELTATLVKGAAGLLAFGVGTRLLGYGFALLHGGAWRVLSLFLRFDKAGKNVSVVSKSVRFMTGFLKRAYGASWALTSLMRTPLRWGVKPLVWSARLIPAIPWLRLATALSWGTLVRPLVWTSRLIPAIGWAAMSGRLGKLGMTKAGWGALITPLKWFGKGALRLIPVIGWAVFAAEVGSFAWKMLGFEPIKWGDYLNADALSRAWDALPTLFMGDKIKKERPKVSETPGFEHLPEAKKQAATIIDDHMRQGAANGNLPTDGYVKEVDNEERELIAKIAALETAIANIKDGPTADTLRRPKEQELAGLKDELQWFQEERQNTADSRSELKAAIAELTGKPADETLGKADLDAALAQVKVDAQVAQSDALADILQPLSAAFEKALTPPKNAGTVPQTSLRPQPRPDAPPAQSAPAAPATVPQASVRPQLRPAEYQAPQPNVTVESTFESNPKVDVKVSVNMPISITRQEVVNRREIAKRAGKEAGAAAERAVNRGLNDAANVQ